MMRLPHLRRWRTKKANLYALIITLSILIIGSYALWSRQTWAQLTPYYTQWHQSLMLDIRSTVDLPVPTAKEQSVVSARLKAISLRIEGDQHAVCGVHSLIQWQQNIIPTFKNTRADCQKIVASVVDFQKQLAKIIAYDNDDQALAGILSTVPQMSEVAEDAMEARMTAWDNTAKNIEKMKVSDAFKLTQQTASKHSMAIKIAWADIIAAHQAKDKQKYLAAQNSLAAAIDDFNEVSNTSQQSVAVLAGDLEKAFRSASTD